MHGVPKKSNNGAVDGNRVAIFIHVLVSDVGIVRLRVFVILELLGLECVSSMDDLVEHLEYVSMRV